MSNVIEQIKVGSTTYKIVDPVTAQLICDNVESGTTASKTYTKGEYVRINDKLYKVTANIATGQAMTEGVNISETNVGDELSQLKSDLANKTGKIELDRGQTIQATDIQGFTAPSNGILFLQIIVTNNCDFFIYLNSVYKVARIRYQGGTVPSNVMNFTIPMNKGDFLTYTIDTTTHNADVSWFYPTL